MRILPLARLLDWAVLQIGFAMLSRSTWREPVNEPELKLEPAVQFLNGPDFIPAESQPAQLDFDPAATDGRFHFPTPQPGEFAENNVVYGRLYRAADAWQKKPAIILLHGGGDIPGHQFGLHLIARSCHRAGFNVATLSLPFHFQRHPRQLSGLDILRQYSPEICRDYLQMARTYAQAVAEIRSLTGWLLAAGCPRVALAGGSLGAYLAGLTACHDTRLTSIIMALPPSRMSLLLSQAEQVGRRAASIIDPRRTAGEALDQTPLNLTLTRPAIAKENILLIEGRHDLMVTDGPMELWQAWSQPEIWRLFQGHISTTLTAPITGLPGRALRWLTPRLNRAAI